MTAYEIDDCMMHFLRQPWRIHSADIQTLALRQSGYLDDQIPIDYRMTQPHVILRYSDHFCGKMHT